MIYIEDSTCINSNVTARVVLTAMTEHASCFAITPCRMISSAIMAPTRTNVDGVRACSKRIPILLRSPLATICHDSSGAVADHARYTATRLPLPAAPPNAVLATSCRDSGVNCGNNPSGNWPPWGACDGSGPYDSNTNATGYRCIDQPGAGTSRLLSGDPPSGGNAQSSVEPIYVWNNTLNGVAFNTTSGSINVQANRDYFTSIARPGYTPLTYPHPLQLQGTSDITPPAPPQNLQAR